MLRIVGWVLLFVILAFICGLIASVPLRSVAETNFLQAFGTVDGDQARRAIEAQFGITFPAEATDFHRANRGDRAYWIQFRIPPNRLSGLFSGSTFKTCADPLEDNQRPTFDYDRLLDAGQRTRTAWWNPMGTQSFAGGECTGSDYKIFRQFADTSNGSAWIYYLEVVRS